MAGVLPPQLIAIIERLGYPPSHVIGYRSETAKLGIYSYFASGTIEIMRQGQQAELYNYTRRVRIRSMRLLWRESRIERCCVMCVEVVESHLNALSVWQHDGRHTRRMRGQAQTCVAAQRFLGARRPQLALA